MVPSYGTAALHPPGRPKVLSTSTSAAALSWKAAAGASGYRVQFATSSTFSSAKSVRASGTTSDLTGLSKGTTYYVRVASLDNAGTVSSRNPTAIEVLTRSSGYSQLALLDLRVTKSLTTSLTLGWSNRGGGIRYRVAYATELSFENPVYRRTNSTSSTLSGLTPNTAYYVRARVIDSTGQNLSAYSPPIKVSTSALAPPKQVRVIAAARKALAVTWAPVSGAERYRIQYARSSSMSKAKYVRVSGSTAEISGLTDGATYYLKIRAITRSGTNLSSYSAALKARTATASGASYLPPSGLSVTPSSTTTLVAGWTARGSGLRYQVQRSTTSTMSGAITVTTAVNRATITGLSPATTYRVRVRVVSSRGDALSSYSSIANGRTRSTAPARIVVASYNVKCTNCYSGLPNEGTWYQRRDSVVAAVLAQRPDVIGFQEASQGWLKDSAGRPVSVAQFDDLVARLGSPYRLTNANRNNCVRSSTPTNCVYQDRGASQGTKIVYNNSTLRLVAQGSKLLPKVKSSDPDRYVAWAILQHKDTGRRFFFADTHMEYHKDAPGSSDYYNLRVAQAKEAVALIQAKNRGLPSYFVGDFNSHKWTVPSNGPYDVMTAAKFVDPLGNTYRSTKSTKGAIVDKRIRTNFSSFNGYATKARSFNYVNGTYIDYIWVSRGIKVPEWETVVQVNTANDFVGRIPSDHNMIRATTVLP